MSGSVSKGMKAEPNLTPMLDMVFQLVTFFMLVINFKSNQIDTKMDLPVVGAARPVDSKGELTMMMININRNGEFTVYNRAQTDAEMESYIAGQAEIDRLAERRKKPDLTDEDDLDAIVVIRADGNTTYETLGRVQKMCQDHGFRNFVFRALSKPPDKKA